MQRYNGLMTAYVSGNVFYFFYVNCDFVARGYLYSK